MRIAVVGAGPAGLMAAGSANPKAEICVFERNDKPGKKLYITGKGRCNVTNACSQTEFLENVVSNPRFLYSAIYSFTPQDTVALLEEQGVHTKIERGRRVFPMSDKASDVTRALVSYAKKNGAKFVYSDVNSVEKRGERFIVTSDDGDSEEFDAVILACGGRSYPVTGSNGDGYKLARALSHTVNEPLPALSAVVTKEDVFELAGLSLKNVRVTACRGKKKFSEFGEMLFTGCGMSGPIILSLSSYITRLHPETFTLSLDLKPALDFDTLDKRIQKDFGKSLNRQFKNSLDELLPKSLIPYIIKRSGIEADKPINSVTREERQKLVALIKDLTFSVESLGDIDDAIVTSGGVAVGEVNPKTMESKLVRGLFFAGEILDVDALTGGFNIQIALSTGYLAGKSVDCK